MITTTKTNLMTSLKSAIIAASVLTSSTNAKDAILLKNLLRNLHGYRRFHPEQEKLICRVIFKIHDMAYYSSSELMRQSAHVGTFCGFAAHPTKDMAITKGLLNRMALVKKIDDMHQPFQTITKHILKNYADQNYQQKDTDLGIAYRLKNLIQIMADRPGKKNATDYRWLHESASQLAQLHPQMKSFAKQFPLVKPKIYKLPPESVRYLAEAAVIYSRPINPKGSNRYYSREDHD